MTPSRVGVLEEAIYWAIDWSGNLYTYDPNAGYTRTQQANGLGALDGLTFVPGLVP